jgi:diguanylate cyclase (GGDEF)-like protein
MSIAGWIVIVLLSILIMGPLYHYGLFQVDEKYKRFYHVSIALMIWNAIGFLRYLVQSPDELYYLSMAIYPVVFLLVVSLLFAMFRYLGIRIPKWVGWLLWVFLVVDALIAFTNPMHEWMLRITPDAGVTFDAIQSAQQGLFFHVHTAVSYLLLIVLLASLIDRLIDQWQAQKDFVPVLLVISVIVIGIIVNLIHIFWYTFWIDPTFITFVLGVSILYYIFYIRDIRLILASGRNRFLLEHLKEEYVLVDQNNRVISTSPGFLATHDIDEDDDWTYEALRERLEDKIVLFSASEELKIKDFSLDKSYWIERTTNIRLPFLKTTGRLHLFYDDTANQRFIHGIQYVKTHDLVTGLYNRNHLEEIRDDLDVSYDHYHLVLFDLDGLKLFNDYHGHQAGDELLIRFAHRLEDWVIQYGGIPIRLGGDEFLWVLLEEDEKTVRRIVHELKHATDDVPILEEVRYSFGVATNLGQDLVLSQVFSQADKNMYQNKHAQDNYKARLEAALKQAKQQQTHDE